MSLADEKPADSRTSSGKKSYTPPRLVSYGHVKDIIQGGGGTKALDTGGAKGAGNSKKQSCWIAEALYGIDDPRTLLLRARLTARYDDRRPGWLFVALYRQFGRQIAALIYSGCLPRAVVRPLFDALVERALDESAAVVAAARR